jgi:hypothetical protein
MSAAWQIAALGAVSVALVSLAIWIALRVHGTPEKRERRRRLSVHQNGRLGDALITDATEAEIHYSYDIRGVHYTAAQDITSLKQYLPAEPHRLIGNAGLKYSSKNPANSILVCEYWSGLRTPVPMSHPSPSAAEPALPEL